MLLDYLKLKFNNYYIVDDIFPESLCERLRQYTLSNKSGAILAHSGDYSATNFDMTEENDPELKKASEIICSKVSLAHESRYLRSWYFVYDTISRGVVPHVDPGALTVNVWVTPEHCIEDREKNGMRLYRDSRQKMNWSYYYNSSAEVQTYLTDKYLKGVKYDKIPYRYNRAIVFGGKTFHSTDYVHTKHGHENKRVNYAFLYD